MEPHVIFLIVFFNPYLLSQSTGYYILKRVPEEPTQEHQQATRQNYPRYGYQPRVLRGSGVNGGSLVNNIATVVNGDGGDADEIIYSDELYDGPAEQPEYIDDEDPSEKHILIRRAAFPTDYENCPEIPSSEYSPIKCAEAGNYPINNTECVFYHHCSNGKYESQRRCCYNDRRFDHVLKVCKPHNEARCPPPAEELDSQETGRINRDIQTAGDFTSAEFGGPAGVGNVMEGLFDMPYYNFGKFPSSVTPSPPDKGRKHGGDKLPQFPNNVGASKGGNGSGSGLEMPQFFDISKFGVSASQNGGNKSQPKPHGLPTASVFDTMPSFGMGGAKSGGNKSKISNQNSESEKAKYFSDNVDSIFESMPVFGMGKYSGKQKASKSKSSNTGGDSQVAKIPNITPKAGKGGGQKKGSQKPTAIQNAGGGPNMADQMSSMFDSMPYFGFGGSKKATGGAPHGGEVASTFDLLHFGAGGGSQRKNQTVSHNHIDHDQMADRFGRHHKHHEAPTGRHHQMHKFDGAGGGPYERNQVNRPYGGYQMNNNFGYGGGGQYDGNQVNRPFGGYQMYNNFGGSGGGQYDINQLNRPSSGNPMNGRSGTDGRNLGLNSLVSMLSNLQSTIPGPFWFHNTKTGHMRPATFSYAIPIIIPVIIEVPSQQTPTTYENNKDFGSDRAQSYADGSPYSLKGGVLKDNPSQIGSLLTDYNKNDAEEQAAPEPVTLDVLYSDESPESPSTSGESGSPLIRPTRESKVMMEGRMMSMDADAVATISEEETTTTTTTPQPPPPPTTTTTTTAEPAKKCEKTVPKARHHNRSTSRGKKRSHNLDNLQGNITVENWGNETLQEDEYEEYDGEDEDSLPGQNLTNSTTSEPTPPLTSSPATTNDTNTTTVAVETPVLPMVPPPADEIDSSKTVTVTQSALPSSTNESKAEDGTDWALDFEESVEVDDMEVSSAVSTTTTPKSLIPEGKETIVLTGVTNRHGQLIKIKPVKRRDKIKAN